MQGQGKAMVRREGLFIQNLNIKTLLQSAACLENIQPNYETPNRPKKQQNTSPKTKTLDAVAFNSGFVN